MSSFEVGYLVGSLATASINRLLAKALVRLAPPELQMTEIPFKDLPPYSYDYDANYPGVERALKNAIATVDAVLFVLSRMIMIAMLRAERTALRIGWGVLQVRFDHPKGLVYTARNLGEQVGSVGVVQACRIIDSFTCAAAECCERVLHRPNVSAPLTDLEGIFAEL